MNNLLAVSGVCSVALWVPNTTTRTFPAFPSDFIKTRNPLVFSRILPSPLCLMFLTHKCCTKVDMYVAYHATCDVCEHIVLVRHMRSDRESRLVTKASLVA